MPVDVERSVWVLDVEQPALVLGSTQRDEVVDRAACDHAGVEVVRRRSGGGAVLLEPGDLWIDVLLPRHDELWSDDVGIAAHWLGQIWADALGPPAVVHRGPLRTAPWSDLICFAGLGPGEVTLGSDGPKVVGISQRRTRAGARFQCVALRRWDSGGIAKLLRAPASLAADLAGVAAGVELDAAALVAFLP